jgi:pantoate--beta-alanine ligase
MKIIRSSEELKSIKFINPSVLIPTMGNLHEGHMSLVNYGKKTYADVITSIFVNPLQFGKNEDFSKYPKTIEKDIKLLEACGCNYLFLPEKDFAKNLKIIKPRFSNSLCGASRPNHFQGVITIINKFLKLIDPDACLFGLKDYQQQLIIKDFVRRLKIKTKIVSLPTVRELNGLAMSSRNNYLSDKEKDHCGLIYSCLIKTSESLINITDKKEIEDIKIKILTQLEDQNFKVDYFEIVDADYLSEISEKTQKILIATAAFYKNVRLIDNLVIDYNQVFLKASSG